MLKTIWKIIVAFAFVSLSVCILFNIFYYMPLNEAIKSSIGLGLIGAGVFEIGRNKL